jgi:hypothetical protein
LRKSAINGIILRHLASGRLPQLRSTTHVTEMLGASSFHKQPTTTSNSWYTKFLKTMVVTQRIKKYPVSKEPEGSF